MLQEIVLSGARKFCFPAIFSIQQFHLPPCPIHPHRLESSESTAEVPPLDFQYVESTINKTSLDDSSGVESSRGLFRPHSISLVYFTSRHQSSGDSSRYLLYTTRLCAGILDNPPVLYTKTWINDESLVTTLFAPKRYREICTCKQGASREELTVHI